MKKKYVAAVSAALILLAGCASVRPAAHEAPAAAPEAAAPAEVQPQRPDPAAYLAHVRSNDPAAYAYDESILLETGVSVCTALRSGVPLSTVVDAGIRSGLGSTTIAALVSGAALYLCPDQAASVQAQAQSGAWA